MISTICSKKSTQLQKLHLNSISVVENAQLKAFYLENFVSVDL